MFTSYPSYQRYRTLLLTTPMMSGEDVYALQTALKAIGVDPMGFDGVLGPNTAKAIKLAQGAMWILSDGLAGPTTQIRLCDKIAVRETNMQRLPQGLLMGHLSHESSCRLGNYSPLRDDNTYDAGVAQRNTAHTEPKDGFNVPVSISALASNERKYFDKFVGLENMRRRWELAAGAWNAPAYASYIAREEGATQVKVSETAKPGPTARAALELYMDSVTSFMS